MILQCFGNESVLYSVLKEIATLFNLSHPSNALGPMRITLFGIDTLLKSKHASNARLIFSANSVNSIALQFVSLTNYLLRDILKSVLYQVLIDKDDYEKEYDHFFVYCNCRRFYLRVLLQR